MKCRAKLASSACAFVLIAGVGISGGASAQARPDGVELPREVVTAASAFSAYMDRATNVTAAVTSPAAVADGLKAGAAYEPVQFDEGMIGYAAMAALQDERFVAGVDAISRGGDRQAMIARILADPSTALRIDGAREALVRIQGALHDRGDALAKSGLGVKQAAYAVQRQPWSKATVGDAADRLAGVKALSSQTLATTDGDDARLFQAVAQTPAPSAGAVAPSPVAMRALALAAEAVLGGARDADLADLKPLLSESASLHCLKMSKLNLFQCMAVAGPQYEDVFCLGQHALADTGQCVAAAAGTASPAAAVDASPQSTPLQATPVAYHRSLVPVARRSVAGSGG